MAVGGLGRDCVAVMQTTESRQGDNLLSPQRHRRTIPVTSKQLKFCCLTFPKIRFNALWDFIPARAGSRDIDSLGWTDREFSCFDAISDHKREGHQGERCPGD
jgi:hypothetical protein